MTIKENNVLERLERKIECLEEKLTDIGERLFDPDQGLYARVNENTRWRKTGQWLLGILLSGMILGIFGILFYIIQKGAFHG